MSLYGEGMAPVWCEDWVERKLRARLELYRARFPAFKVDRVMEIVGQWDPKRQRWAPYMTDKDIQRITSSIHKSASLDRLARNDNW